jgi:guanine nucleotide-binding protein G(i) subunit alpha
MILLARIDADPNYMMEPELAKAIELLWHDPVMPKVMERSSEFYLMDSAP